MSAELLQGLVAITSVVKALQQKLTCYKPYWSQTQKGMKPAYTNNQMILYVHCNTHAMSYKLQQVQAARAAGHTKAAIVLSLLNGRNTDQ